MNIWVIQDLGKEYGGYTWFRTVFYLVPEIRFEEGLLPLEIEVDVLGMCNTTSIDPEKDVHIYI